MEIAAQMELINLVCGMIFSAHLFEYLVDIGNNGEYLLTDLHLFIIEFLAQTVGIDSRSNARAFN